MTGTDIPIGDASSTGPIEAVLGTDRVTPATRRALRERLAWSAQGAPRCFDAHGYATLQAICERLIPQLGERRVDLAMRMDARLAEGVTDGWRYDALPPDAVAMPVGVAGVDEAALAMFGLGFLNLSSQDQDAVLSSVQAGNPPGPVWVGLPAKRFFEVLLASVAQLYYAHPYAQDRIGYLGMADAWGFRAIGLNQRDPDETGEPDAPA